MTIQAKCIDKYRNNNGAIFGYALMDNQGKTIQIESAELKKLIFNKQIDVINLTLTSDNRLIDKEIKDEVKVEDNNNDKMLNTAIDDIRYLVCKNAESNHKSKDTWNVDDIHKVIGIFNNLGINIYRVHNTIKLDYNFDFCCGRYLICFNGHGIGIRGFSVKEHTEYTNTYTSKSEKSEIRDIIKLLKEETYSNIKNLGIIINKISNHYRNITKKARLSDILVITTYRSDNAYIIQCWASRNNKRYEVSSAVITTYNIQGIMGDTIEYAVHYKNELNEFVEVNINELYNTETNVLENGFQRTIAEGKRKFSLSNIIKVFN